MIWNEQLHNRKSREQETRNEREMVITDQLTSWAPFYFFDCPNLIAYVITYYRYVTYFENILVCTMYVRLETFLIIFLK